MKKENCFRIALIIGIGLLLAAVPVLLAVPASAQAKGQPIKIIRLYTTKFGTMGYILGFAVKDILDKRHPWLRAEVVETLSSMEAAARIAGSSEFRKTGISSSGSDKFDMFKKGKPPLKKPITDYKFLALSGKVDAYVWATLDPNIKTPQDLIGKTVNPCTVAAFGNGTREQLKQWGIYDKVKMVAMSQNAGKDALRDKTIHAGAFTMSVKANIKGSSALEELISYGGHIIGLTAKEVRASSRRVPGTGAFQLKPKDPKYKPTNGDWVMTNYKVYFGFTTLPNEIAYEFVKVLDVYRDELALYYAGVKGCTTEMLAEVPFSESEFHPGAVKYFKEKGVKIGIE